LCPEKKIHVYSLDQHICSKVHQRREEWLNGSYNPVPDDLVYLGYPNRRFLSIETVEESVMIVCILCEKFFWNVGQTVQHLNSREHKRKAWWEAPASQAELLLDRQDRARCGIGLNELPPGAAAYGFTEVPGYNEEQLALPGDGVQGETRVRAWLDLSKIVPESRRYCRVEEDYWVVCTLCERKCDHVDTLIENHLSSERHTRNLSNAMKLDLPPMIVSGLSSPAEVTRRSSCAGSEAALPAGWSVHEHPVSGVRYYWDIETKVSQWNRPVTDTVEEAALPDGWSVYEHPDSGVRYYWDSNANVSQWTRPVTGSVPHGGMVQAAEVSFLSRISRLLRGVVVKDAWVLGYGKIGVEGFIYDEICGREFASPEQFLRHVAGQCIHCEVFAERHTEQCLGLVDHFRPSHFDHISSTNYLQAMVTPSHELYVLDHKNLTVKFVQESELDAIVGKIQCQWKVWWADALQCEEVLVMCEYEHFVRALQSI